MAEHQLPPLPECDSYCTHKDMHDYEVWSAEQMREYALAAIALASPHVAVQEERDAKDAARYRWLREEAQHFPHRAPAVVLCDESDFFEKGDASSDHGFISGSRLDAAIDSAMKGDQP